MKTEMTLTFEGLDVPELKKPMEILVWSWGVHYVEEEKEVLGDKVKAGVHAQDISMTKYVGFESPKLLALIFKNKKIQSATLSLNNIESESGMTIKLKCVKLTSLSTGGSRGESEFTEYITLSFQEFEMKKSVKSKDGKVLNSSESISIN